MTLDDGKSSAAIDDDDGPDPWLRDKADAADQPYGMIGLVVSADADVATCVRQRTTVAGQVAIIVASILETAADSRESS